MKALCVFLNLLAFLLLLKMNALKAQMRLSCEAITVINILLLLAIKPENHKITSIGMKAAIASLLGAPLFWTISAFGCGLEYVNASCVKMVDPFAYAAIACAFLSIPLSYALQLLVSFIKKTKD